MKIKRKVYIELPIEEFQRLELDLKADERFQFSILHNDGVDHLAFALKSDWSSILVVTPKPCPTPDNGLTMKGPEDGYAFEETAFRTRILRAWDRNKIERFARHLLGDTAQAEQDVIEAARKVNKGKLFGWGSFVRETDWNRLKQALESLDSAKGEKK